MRTLFAAAALWLAGCGSLDAVHDSYSLNESVTIDRETGKPLLGSQSRAPGLEASGPRVSGLSASTEVWNVHRRWYQTDDAEGMAWSAGSGLTWDEKYAAWVDSMVRTTGDDGLVTVELVTPFGQRLPSPRLECAEMGMFLRTVFASWYGLPFFMTAQHPTMGTLHFGHFGVVTDSGARASGYPNYATRYEDHSALGVAALDGWPTDANLASRKLTALSDDYNAWMGEDKYAGAYFDAVLLNKRVGHFLHVLLTNFGSMHLAYSTNTFDLDPVDMREGDVLVHRWQRQGIGHVMVLKEVDEADGLLSAELMFGSMPRIQPIWYDASDSRGWLLAQDGGGKEISGDGVAYAELGGGLKRWRTPVVKSNRWLNIIPVADREFAVDSSDVTALGDRLEDMEELFGQLSDDDRLGQITSAIEIARDNLRRKPASCANRIRREEAFDELYDFMESYQGMSRAEVDAQYRTLEDYVFAELEYNSAKTCCWNSTTSDMYEIAMDFNRERIEAEPGTCVEPVVFKARGGHYDLFENYAIATGRGDLWRDWSEDETCPQRNVLDDVEVEADHAAYCEIQPPGAPSVEPPASDDPCGGITFVGQCDSAQLVVWCDGSDIYEMACDAGQVCGYSEASSYYTCVAE